MNASLKYADTTLTMAAQFGHTRCVKRLATAGADVNKSYQNGFPAALTVALNGHGECVSELLEVKDIVSEIHYPARYGNYDCLNACIKVGADVNLADLDGVTPLMEAASSDHLECVKLLVNSGADVNQVNDVGNTALLEASRYGHNKCVSFLIESGADVNTAIRRGPYSGNTALFEATTSHSIECIKILLIAGARVNKTNSLGHNALQYYLIHCHPPDADIVLLLYAAGEIIDGTTIETTSILGKRKLISVPDFLLSHRLNVTLMGLCRETIRNRFLKLNPSTHLFCRVPSLGFPRSLASYLLYGRSLHEEQDIN